MPRGYRFSPKKAKHLDRLTGLRESEPVDWKPRVSGVSVNAGWARTPSGGIPAASDDGTDLTPGSATCTLMDDDGSTISPVSPSENVTIYSSLTGADIPGDIVIGWIERPSGKKYIDLGNCPASEEGGLEEEGYGE